MMLKHKSPHPDKYGRMLSRLAHLGRPVKQNFAYFDMPEIELRVNKYVLCYLRENKILSGFFDHKFPRRFFLQNVLLAHCQGNLLSFFKHLERIVAVADLPGPVEDTPDAPRIRRGKTSFPVEGSLKVMRVVRLVAGRASTPFLSKKNPRKFRVCDQCWLEGQDCIAQLPRHDLVPKVVRNIPRATELKVKFKKNTLKLRLTIPKVGNPGKKDSKRDTENMFQLEYKKQVYQMQNNLFHQERSRQEHLRLQAARDKEAIRKAERLQMILAKRGISRNRIRRGLGDSGMFTQK
jgi:hypothetical protein